MATLYTEHVLYTGKLSDIDNSNNSLMLQLSEKYLPKGHKIYMERFYSSPTLFDSLVVQKDISSRNNSEKRKGTARSNKKHNPPKKMA